MGLVDKKSYNAPMAESSSVYLSEGDCLNANFPNKLSYLVLITEELQVHQCYIVAS